MSDPTEATRKEQLVQINVTVATSASCVGWYLGSTGFQEFHRNDEGCKDGEVTRFGQGALLARSDPAM